MTTLAISLPEAMLAFVEGQTAARGYADPSDYVLALICEAQRVQERTELEAKLLVGIEALERGEGTEMKCQDWERLRDEYRARRSQGKGQ